MDFLELVKRRHSVRIYEKKEISREVLEYVLEAARLAPSAFNAQEFKFIVTSDKTKIEEIAKVAGALFIKDAPLVVVAVGLDPDNKYNIVNVAIALDHLQLAAANRDLGSCWVGTLGHRDVEKIFEFDERAKVFAVMPLGYDAGKVMEKKRKNFDELFLIED